MSGGRVVIRADGGPRIGFGHVVRTGALATAFQEKGWAVTYATATPEAVRTVVDGVDVLALDSRNTPTAAASIAPLRPAVVVIDSYEIGLEEQKRLGERADVTGVLLDDARPVRADVVVNGNLYGPALEYEWTGPEPAWCLGPAYLPLREGFRDGRERSLWRDPPEHALITMGGSDARNTTPTAIRAFTGIRVPETLTVVVGPGFENRGAIETAARASDHEVSLLHDPDRETLIERMYDADLAVSALGSTTYELLASATPQVGVVQADNQRPIATALEAREAAVVLDPNMTDSGRLVNELRGTIRELVADTDRRRSLHDRGPEIVDGRGAERVRDELISHRTQRGS